MSLAIVRTLDQPDLAAIVARWLWEAFGRRSGGTLDQSMALVMACTAETGPDQSFVLLQGGKPIGTAGFVAHDLDERPDLTPWLAGVYVVPEARGHGHVGLLIRTVEAAARTAGTRTLWLYTSAAERVYRKHGWSTDSHFGRSGRTFALMSRDLGQPPEA